MKTYLPIVLVIGGVHLALIFLLTLLGNLPAMSESKAQSIEVPAEALQKDCALHRVSRSTGAVQVTYGSPAVAHAYLDARARYFPNAWYFIEGGAEITSDGPRQATVRFCPTCRAAEQRWRTQFARR